MRNQLVLSALFFLLVPSTYAQQQWTPTDEDLTVIKTPVKEGPRITPFLHYLLEKAWAQDDRRAERLRAIKSEQDLLRLQQELRASLLKNIGGLPETRTPLNPRVLGTITQPGYRIEKIVFESLPHFYVTALLWIPEGNYGNVRFPAVLVPCGHSTNGKILYQYICQRLAKRGYVALCWDPVGQGERSQFWDPATGKTRYNLVCGEHAVVGNLAYLAGANLARWEIWDGMRALDYLLTRPEVDPERISITGTSGGGTQTALITALDTRIKTAAPSCYISSLPMRMANRIFADPDSDPEQDISRMVADGIDHSGLLLLVFPRPLILAAAVQDFFPIEGTRKTFHEIQNVYRYLGKADSISMVEGYHRHQYSPENMTVTFQFLDRFNRIPGQLELAPFEPLDEKLLLCTKSGQVSTEFPDAVPLTRLIRDIMKEKPSEPVRVADLYRSGYAGINQWTITQFSERPVERSISWEPLGLVHGSQPEVSRYLLHHSDGELAMPLIHVKPANPRSPRRAALLIRMSGKVRVTDWPIVKMFADQGYDVVSFDFRGVGEQRMRYSTQTPEGVVKSSSEADYFDSLNSIMANYVYNSLLVGRPYLLQMIEDIEIASRFTREKLGVENISLVASNPDDAAAVWAATQCLPGVQELYSSGAQKSFKWSEAVEQQRELWPIQLLIPGGAYIQ